MTMVTFRSERRLEVKTVLIITAVISVIGAIAESKKGYWIALFAISALLYIIMNALGGAA